MTINHKVLQRFQKLVTRQLSGEWVLIGGAVLHLLNIDERLTLDIDLARKSGKSDESLELMKIAENLGLPITAVNQAGSFFLPQISHWEKKLILCAESKRCRLYRPNGTLYLQLKIKRMSESDFQDCLQMMKYCHQTDESLDIPLLQKDLKKASIQATSKPLMKRLERLAQALEAIKTRNQTL